MNTERDTILGDTIESGRRAAASRYAVIYFGLGVAALAIFIWQSTRSSTDSKSPLLTAGGKIAPRPGPGRWVPVQGVKLGDIASLTFTPDGIFGALISSDGAVMQSSDGGASWQAQPRPPIDSDAEVITALSIMPPGLLVVGTHIDESDFTGLYTQASQRNWKAENGANGGITCSTPNGWILAGGSGLLGVRQGEGWHFIKVPGCENSTFRAVASWETTILVAGEDGLVARSTDDGATWVLKRVPPPVGAHYPQHLHAVAINRETAFAGGLDGTLWRSDSRGDRWARVTGLSQETMVAALYAPSETEIIAAGGDPTGTKPFVCYSADAGLTWGFEPVHTATARITSIARGQAGLFAATADGFLLKRQ